MSAQRIAGWLAVPARWYLGILFIGACVHKIVNPGSFALDVATYDILPLSLINITAITLPWIELAAGVMLITGWRVRPAALLIAGMMVVFIAALVIALARGLDMSCGCFASQGAEEDPISYLTVLRDLVWFGLSVLVFACDRSHLGIDHWRRWRTSMRATVTAVAIFLVGLTAHAQTPTCDSLSAKDRRLAEQILSSEYVYDCCDDTISACLQQQPPCSLATRLAENVCRRVTAGQDENRIRRGLSRRARSMVSGGRTAEIDIDAAPKIGPDDAPVTVVIYACARCPYCSRIIPQLHKAITTGEIRDDVRLVFRIFPIRGHEGSTTAGLGFAAAARLQKFWPFMLKAYENFDDYSPEKQILWAASTGIDQGEFEDLVADPSIREELVASKKEGLVNKVEETPTIFINGRRWVGDLEAEELLDAFAEEAARIKGES